MKNDLVAKSSSSFLWSCCQFGNWFRSMPTEKYFDAQFGERKWITHRSDCIAIKRPHILQDRSSCRPSSSSTTLLLGRFTNPRPLKAGSITAPLKPRKRPCTMLVLLTSLIDSAAHQICSCREYCIACAINRRTFCTFFLWVDLSYLPNPDIRQIG